MPVYLVTYDLKRPQQNYQGLYEVLKKADSWWHYLESTWLIKTSETVDAWQTRLRSTLDDNDLFMIMDLKPARYSGWLPQPAWDWIRTNLG